MVSDQLTDLAKRACTMQYCTPTMHQAAGFEEAVAILFAFAATELTAPKCHLLKL
jgi:hypothetical protein